jgi:hypothetical protein
VKVEQVKVEQVKVEQVTAERASVELASVQHPPARRATCPAAERSPGAVRAWPKPGKRTGRPGRTGKAPPGCNDRCKRVHSHRQSVIPRRGSRQRRREGSNRAVRGHAILACRLRPGVPNGPSGSMHPTTSTPRTSRARAPPGRACYWPNAAASPLRAADQRRWRPSALPRSLSGEAPMH